MDLMERERTDPDWRNKELRKLAEPLQMEYSVAKEMAFANHQMRCHDAMESLSPEEVKIFIAGLKEHLNYCDEVEDLRRDFENKLHNIYDTWVKKANAEVSRHIT